VLRKRPIFPEKDIYRLLYGYYRPARAVTTIQIEAATRRKLARLKSSPRETYDDVLNRLLALVPAGDDEGRYGDGFRQWLLGARLDIREGRFVDHKDVKRRLAL